MAVGIVRPNADGATLQWTPSTGVVHYTCIDDSSSASAGYDVDTEFISRTGAAGTFTDEIEMETISGVSSVTSVTVWIRAVDAANGVSVSTNGSIFMGGAYLTNVNFSVTSTEGWFSATFNGSWTQSDLDAMKVRLQWIASATVGQTKVFVMYADVTYTAAAGNTGNFFLLF